MDREKLLTVDEVAGILRVSPSTVYRRIQAGELPAVKLGHRQVRIKPEDLAAYIEAHRIETDQRPTPEDEPVKGGVRDA